MGNIFIAGIYGVGKSYFANELSEKLEIPNFSASNLIKLDVGETYEKGKHVHDKAHNQRVLIKNVRRLNDQCTSIIIDGHLCIFTKLGEADEISLSVLENLNIRILVLLKDKPINIHTRMESRDSHVYSIEQLELLQECEIKQFTALSEILNVKSIVYDISESNKGEIIQQVQGGDFK